MKNILNKIKNFIKNNKFIILSLLYLLWPLDIIPEVFAFAGGPIVFLDDTAILLFAVIQKVIQYLKRRKVPTVEDEKNIK